MCSTRVSPTIFCLHSSQLHTPMTVRTNSDWQLKASKVRCKNMSLTQLFVVTGRRGTWQQPSLSEWQSPFSPALTEPKSQSILRQHTSSPRLTKHCYRLTTPCLWITTPCLWITTPCLWITTPCLWITTPCLWITTPCLWIITPCLWITTPCLWITRPVCGYPRPVCG